MQAFAERTGLVGNAEPRRYLWTDAFAVCNWLALYQHRPEQHYLDLSLSLVDQVHDVLGRYAPNDPREGWLGGVDDQDHRDHPTAHGLRIGKGERERPAGESPDPRREWDRDGQYFHYLTRWMQALARLAEVTGEQRYHRWAVELAETACRAFVVQDSRTGAIRMVWKMSVDLDRPQVPSMGHHDPLDGWVTSLTLQASPHADDEQLQKLDHQATTYLSMCRGRDWTTGDALGIGGLLLDVWRLFRIRQSQPEVEASDVAALLSAGASGLADLRASNELQRPAAARLAFRELGLALGLRAVEAVSVRLDDQNDQNDQNDENDRGNKASWGQALREPLSSLRGNFDLARQLAAFWQTDEAQSAQTWRDHADINDAMLVAALLPEGVLGETVQSDSMNDQ